jgi:hypothetical protein
MNCRIAGCDEGVSFALVFHLGGGSQNDKDDCVVHARCDGFTLWGVGIVSETATNQCRHAASILSGRGRLPSFLDAGSKRIPLQLTHENPLCRSCGICSSLGGLLFLYAVRRKASVSDPFTALYPLITIILSFTILVRNDHSKAGYGKLALISMVLLAGCSQMPILDTDSRFVMN